MLYQCCWNNLVTGLIVPSSLLQFVNSLFQTCSNKFGTSSANTSCQQLVNRLVTTCLQVCSNLCVFTCVSMSLHVQGGEILYGGQLPRERGFCHLFLSESVSEPLFFCVVVSLVLSVFVCFFLTNGYDDDDDDDG